LVCSTAQLLPWGCGWPVEPEVSRQAACIAAGAAGTAMAAAASSTGAASATTSTSNPGTRSAGSSVAMNIGPCEPRSAARVSGRAFGGSKLRQSRSSAAPKATAKA
jgi:hypothetical protein